MSGIKQQPGYSIFKVLTVLATLAAVFTLLPDASASKACLLGYKARCAWAPVSTAICLVVSLAACMTRVRLFTKKEAQ
jgi:hypothetical protein